MLHAAWKIYIAFALFLPFLIWNATNSWASFQFWAGYSHNHLAGVTPLDFLTGQILGMNPFSLLLWWAGLWYFFSARGARYRVFGWAYLLLFVLFIVIQGKSYFLAPAYPPLFASGALFLGEWRLGFRRWVAVYCQNRSAATTSSISGDREGAVARSLSRSIFLKRMLHGGLARCILLPGLPALLVWPRRIMLQS